MRSGVTLSRTSQRNGFWGACVTPLTVSEGGEISLEGGAGRDLYARTQASSLFLGRPRLEGGKETCPTSPKTSKTTTSLLERG